MARDNIWSNSDGLVVGFGTRTVTTSAGAAARTSGYENEVIVKIVGTDLGDTVAATDEAIVHGAVIPNDSLILSADLFVTTAFAGATAVLDIGVYDAGDGSIVDDDGIDAAIAVASLSADAVIAADGADIGTVVATANGVVVAASYDTAAFTAGEATLVVRYVTEAP